MQHIPPLKTLPVFLSVCHHRNFTRAAEELCLTHSAVSQNIKQLEDFLGKRLIERTTRQMRLTEAGERYLRSIGEGMSLITRATEFELRDEGHVSINVLHTLAIKWLIPKLPQFMQSCPGIDLRLSTQNFSQLDLRRDNLDLAIVYGEERQWPNYVAQRLCRDDLLLVGSPSLRGIAMEKLFTEQSQIRVRDPLREEDWLIWIEHCDVEPFIGNHVLTFQSSVQAIQAAIAGLGIFVTHRLFVEEEIQNGLLVQLSLQVVPSKYHYFLISLPEVLTRPCVRKTMTWLQSSMGA